MTSCTHPWQRTFYLGDCQYCEDCGAFRRLYSSLRAFCGGSMPFGIRGLDDWQAMPEGRRLKRPKRISDEPEWW